MRRSWLVAGFALAMSLGATAAARGEVPVDETVRASAGGDVSIDNLAGSVTVKGWDRDEVRVQGTRADVAEVAVESDRTDRFAGSGAARFARDDRLGA